MNQIAARDLLERDKSIVELRTLLASYEHRLSMNADRTPEAHVAATYRPEPVFLLNDVAVDLRPAAVENYAVLEAPGVVDCSKREEPEPFTCVYKVASGVFRVHPRPGVPTIAAIGPFAGPPPSGLIATAQTVHGAAPTVRFHISTWIGEIDSSRIQEKLGSMVPASGFLTVPPRHQGFLVSTSEAQSPDAGADGPWGLILATVGDPPDETAYAWAEFSDIALVFSSESGSEVRLLS